MKVAVIGGGASGMVASIMLKKNGHDVYLFEKNNMLGKKLLITGKGRCNLTNNTSGPEFLQNVVRGAKFFQSAEHNFNSADTIKFFEDLGVKTKVERGGRVFPETEKAKDVRDALQNALKNLKVNVNLNTQVEDILIENNKICGIIVNGEKLNFDAVIVATGGKSYPQTGSSGDGFVFAKHAGHLVEELKPALNGIEISGNECKTLEGLSLKNVCICAKNKGKVEFKSEIGEMLFTDVGISGPLVLTMSSFVNRKDIDEVCINFKPALSTAQIKDKIDRIITQTPTKTLSSLLASMLPKRLVQVFAKRLGAQLTLKINQLKREDRENLVKLLSEFSLKFKRVEPIETSVITSGGVSLREINPKDMQSKIIKGLFFIGEVLDVDALTGGFNLQIAFSSAASCANSNYFKGEK